MLGTLFERFGLSDREQKLASGAIVALLLVGVLAIPFAFSSVVASRNAENEQLRDALSAVNGARAKVKQRQDQKAAIIARYENKAPQLAGFIEQQAGPAKIQIADSTDRQPVNHGKQYTERHTIVHLKNTGMAPIVSFFETIEKSGHPVAITRLSIRKRSAEPDSYGPVEIGISAFDREATAAAGANEKSAGQAGGEKGK